jgi:methylated-DNA-protein-cysteine methyltransferase related protein
MSADAGGKTGSEARGLSPFEQQVEAVIHAIPAGSVLSYGQVAIRAGRPQGARAVARALRKIRGVPWWRVVRADRTLAPVVAEEQARLLTEEGVVVEGRRIVSLGPQLPHGTKPE